MTKVLFVCLGNICRSPMAEFMFKDLVRQKGMQDNYYIDSAATSFEEIGNGVHFGARRKLDEVGISYTDHRARRLTSEDYENFDYIIGMEEKNISNIIRIVGEDFQKKVFKLLDFSGNPRDIADPWYTGNFDKTYADIKEGLNDFWNYLEKDS